MREERRSGRPLVKTSDTITVPNLSKLRSVSVASATPDDLKRMRKAPCSKHFYPVEKMRTAKWARAGGVTADALPVNIPRFVTPVRPFFS